MRAPTRELNLREWLPSTFDKSQLSEKVAIELAKSKFVDVEWPTPLNDRKFVVTPRHHIGSIPVGGDTIVRIEPKVPVGNVFGMLELAYGLKSFKLHRGLVASESIPELYERLATILSQGVTQRVRRGLHQEYEQFNENETLIRGRVELASSMKLWARASPKVQCEYHLNTVDNPDNQILAWTLDKLHRHGINRAITRQQVEKARRALQRSVSLDRSCVSHLANRSYSKLNADYEPLHAICRFFLENSGPGLSSGSRSFIPFTVDMATLFEVFVAKWLQSALPKNLLLRKQVRHYLGDGDQVYFQIDIVIIDRGTGEAVCVLDTKYKKDRVPSSTDIQQAVAYSVQVNTDKACLVYPSVNTQLQERSVGPDSAVVIYPLVFDLSKDLQDAGNEFLLSLMQILDRSSGRRRASSFRN